MQLKDKSPKSSATIKASTLIAIGDNGTAICLTAPYESFPTDGTPTVAQYRGFKSTGIAPGEIGELHGRGEACGLPEWDAALFVSPRGKPTRVMPLLTALNKGLVSKVQVLLSRDGERREVTVYAPKGWTTASKVPQFLASLDVKALRIERHAISDGRNKTYTGKILPLTFAKTTPPQAIAPAKSPKTPPAPVKPAKTPAAPVKPAAKTPVKTPAPKSPKTGK